VVTCNTRRIPPSSPLSCRSRSFPRPSRTGCSCTCSPSRPSRRPERRRKRAWMRMQAAGHEQNSNFHDVSLWMGKGTGKGVSDSSRQKSIECKRQKQLARTSGMSPVRDVDSKHEQIILIIPLQPLMSVRYLSDSFIEAGRRRRKLPC